MEPGEEYERVVEEVLGVLQRLRDPVTGDSPFSAIYRREELWDGPYIDNGPDVVTEPAPGYLSLSELKDEAFMEVGTSWRDKSADHEREGIVILHGPGVRRGEAIEPRHIEDIAPTILHLCGLPVPRYMDGSVIDLRETALWLMP